MHDEFKTEKCLSAIGTDEYGWLEYIMYIF